ncbi:YkvA family protein [Halomarina halobia]|uniref:YkvA family protein n=1 Tax=Halomarina halobia TaxID=3033386 RepID=A0ABD6AAK1_9EURY|nr:DUF1232 domain-containing protein [Halomarina sp. PSR21]
MVRFLSSALVEAYALVRVALDRRTPRRAAALVLVAVAYLLVPIDLLPDVIPVLGWGDDLLLGVLARQGVASVVPDDVLEEHRDAAREQIWVAAGVVLSVLALSVVAVAWRLGWL